jgi:hypothetical protein
LGAHLAGAARPHHPVGAQPITLAEHEDVAAGDDDLLILVIFQPVGAEADRRLGFARHQNWGREFLGQVDGRLHAIVARLLEARRRDRVTRILLRLGGAWQGQQEGQGRPAQGPFTLHFFLPLRPQ